LKKIKKYFIVISRYMLRYSHAKDVTTDLSSNIQMHNITP